MRAFIAVKVPENEKIANAIKKLTDFKELKITNPKKMHITLKFLGEISEERAEQVGSKLEKLKGTGPFSVKIKGTGFFPKKEFIKVIWAGAESDKLISLNEIIENELEKIGFIKEKNKYTPHLTLARAKAKPPEEIKKCLHDGEFFEFKAGEIILMRSDMINGEYEYTEIKTVKL